MYTGEEGVVYTVVLEIPSDDIGYRKTTTTTVVDAAAAGTGTGINVDERRPACVCRVSTAT